MNIIRDTKANKHIENDHVYEEHKMEILEIEKEKHQQSDWTKCGEVIEDDGVTLLDEDFMMTDED